MSTKHTQGPWEAKFRPFSPSYEIGVRAPNGSLDLIASLKDSVPQGNEREANARLIAAAPQLLEALKNVIFENESQLFRSVAAQAIAAIAAAESN